MENKIQEKGNTDSSSGKQLKDAWKTKRTVRLGVDFQKIEDHPKTDLHFEILEKLATQPSPADILIEHEQREIVRGALKNSKLSNRERECARLTIQGLSNLEIAEELGISNSAVVRMHVRRATSKLKTFLKNEGSKNKF